jgi:hypothetical protein
MTTMRIMAVQLLLVAALAGVQADARAAADGPDHFVVRDVPSGEVLNIREEPNARSRVTGAIPHNGSCIRNLGCQGGLTLREFSVLTPAQRQQRLRRNPGWCRVEYQGVTGWAAGRFLAEGQCAPR